jgi:uncharacterized membrane protein YcaP (DUF421 family)
MSVVASISYDLFHLDVPFLEKVLRALLIYGFLVVALRLAGKREMAQLNSLDFIVLLTVANAVQNGIIGSDNSVSGAVLGAAVLFAINFAMAVLLFRSVRWRKVIQGSATILIEDGVVDKRALRHEKLCEEDLLAAVESQGATDFAEVSRAILEPNGTIVTLLKTPNYETQHFLALSQQIQELREALDHASWMAAVASPKPYVGGHLLTTTEDLTGDHQN